jgi:hypothetical protein
VHEVGGFCRYVPLLSVSIMRRKMRRDIKMFDEKIAARHSMLVREAD